MEPETEDDFLAAFDAAAEEMPDEFLAAFDAAGAPAPGAIQQQPELSPEEAALTPGYYLKHGEPGLQQPNDAGKLAEGLAGGAAEAVFETKDFLFGEPGEGETSDLRDSIQERTSALKNDGVFGALAVNIGQFATGMAGLGKVTAAARALPWFGKVAQTAAASRSARVAVEIGKPAVVGAVAFDPWEERISNLLVSFEGTPLANPVTRWLAADPNDSAAEGRFKSALESIGLDAALGIALGGGLAAYKALARGDTAGARAAVEAMEAAEAEDIAREAPVGTAPPERASAPVGTAPPERASAPQADALEAAGLTSTVEDLYRDKASGAESPGGLTITLRSSAGAEMGTLEAREVGDAYRIFNSGLDDTIQGKGLGVALYERFVAEALQRGKAVISDMDVSERAGHVYEALKRRGYSVERVSQNVTAETVAGRRMQYAQDGEPIYRISGPSPKAAAIEPDIEVTAVPNTTEAMRQAGTAPAENPAFRAAMDVSVEDTESVLKSMAADAEAIETFGSREAAISGGYAFGKGAKVPYGKLATEEDVALFTARVVDAAEGRLNAIKGGDILSDPQVMKTVDQYVRLFNVDKGAALAMIQRGGEAAANSVAQMEAGFLMSSQMLQDAYSLAARIKIGDYTEGGTREAAVAELRKRISLASSVYGSAKSISANAGRAMRRMRQEFVVSQENLAKLNGVDDNSLVDLFDATKGDPAAVVRALNPNFWETVRDGIQYLYVNNLVSGWQTQLINAASSAYMIGARPMERLIGGAAQAAVGNPAGRGMMKEASRQYLYTASSLTSSWKLAYEAFKRNDSVMAPHKTELYRANQGAERSGIGAQTFRPWSSTGNVLYNTLVVGTKSIGLPTRTLGAVDEMVKQTVYRSKLMAKTHVEAAQQAAEMGLKGAEAEKYVRDSVKARIDNAFDDMGRATDPFALQEANIATYQQDLLPSTLGKSTQTFLANHPNLKLVVPFVKTPVNVLRYGWKLTPGLNVIQREYNAMLRGKMGPEAQAQAYGQMGLGFAFLGAAAAVVSMGGVTGGGPRNWRDKEALMATGWREYAFVRSNPDGTKTFVPYNRFDPIALPFGIIADMQDAIHAIGEHGNDYAVTEAIVGLAMALSKQFTSKSYMSGVNQALEAITDDSGDAAIRFFGQMGANLIPYSAMLRATNPDEHLRESRDLADRAIATIPGLSESLPAKYDALGEKMLTRRGLWSNEDDAELDGEMSRLWVEGDQGLVPVMPRIGDVDLREVTMSTGENAYEKYQQLSGGLPGAPRLKDTVLGFMRRPEYLAAPDGDRATRGTKLWLLHQVVSPYREAALATIKQDPVVQERLGRKQREVLDAYTNMMTQPAPDVGSAFGVDLGGAF